MPGLTNDGPVLDTISDAVDEGMPPDLRCHDL